MNLYAAGRGASRLRASMRSNRGRSHERNEDASLVDLGRGLFVVADGVSGNRRGDVAAQVVIDRLPDLLDAARSEAWADLDSAIQRAVVDLGGVVRAEARSSPDLAGMATTVVVLMIVGETAHVAHLGDSRAYLCRDGSLRRLTEDHSFAAELAQSGVISAEEAEEHPFAHSITQAVGLPNSSAPSVQRFPLAAGDRLLLCTDGLTDVLTDERIEAVLAEHSDPDTACEALVAEAAGGRDDVTVVIVDHRPPGNATT